MSRKYETDYTKEIVCPHCGHKYRDSWEYNDESGTVWNCDECEKEFILTVDFDITYCTEKVEPAPEQTSERSA